MSARVLTVAGAALLAGCGVSDDRRQSRETAAAFYADVQRGDGRAACERLAPPTSDALEREEREPCERAVVKLELSGGQAGRVEVFQTSASVSFGDELAYLDRRAGAWKVSAAGCRPRPPGPAQCEAED